MDTPFELPHIDEKCGEHFTYRDFIECSDSWKKHPVANIPKQLKTYRAIERLCSDILDPVWSTFGEVILTYGFSSPTLVAEVKKNKFPCRLRVKFKRQVNMLQARDCRRLLCLRAKLFGSCSLGCSRNEI